MKTVDTSLVFERDYTCHRYATGFINSDYVGDMDKRQSKTDYLITLARAPVSWKSILQSTIALSTIEAEYMTLTEVIKEIIWLGGLLDELGLVRSKLLFFSDSQSVICLAKNLVFYVRTKHIDICYHFV